MPAYKAALIQVKIVSTDAERTVKSGLVWEQTIVL